MELYHVLNRGTEKRQIYMDDRDRARFIHDMYEFNDRKPAGNAYRRFPMMDVGRPSWVPSRKSVREKLVDIHGWCLMGNHYHLLLSETDTGDVSLFMKKLNGGYAKYFNERYERSGTLFQGRTKKILIENDAHFLHILHYIHLNPLDFDRATESWRDGRIQNADHAFALLKRYRWSSFLDYCGQKNFPSVLTTDLFAAVFKNYERVVRRYLGDSEIRSPRARAYYDLE